MEQRKQIAQGDVLMIPCTEEDTVFVEVINGTVEADGKRKHYYLRVPPNMKTARQAVAWTYGLEEHEYNPEVRT